MRKDIRRRREAHVRTNGVCTEHSAIFDATTGGQKTRIALATCVADEDRQLALQKQSIEDRRSSTEQIRRGRRALRDFARGIVKIGPLVNLDAPLMETLTSCQWQSRKAERQEGRNFCHTAFQTSIPALPPFRFPPCHYHGWRSRSALRPRIPKS